MTAQPGGTALLQTVTSLRELLSDLALPLDITGVELARRDRRDLIAQLDDYVIPRLADLDAPLLAVVGGSTGAGKSTLVNTLAGRVVSRSGVLRPTTRAPVLVHHADDTAWFTTPRVLPGLRRVTGADLTHDDPSSVRLVAAHGLPAGIALVDAPDIDSVVQANRELARQLLAAADLWLFTTTAARYADAVPWDLLRHAVERGASVAIVLNRVPEEALDPIGDHLAEMLSDRGLRHAPLFVLAETELTDSGLLPEDQVQPIREWLTRLGQDARARGLVVGRTLGGTLDAVERRTTELAEASFAQIQTVQELDAILDTAFRDALAEVSTGISDGTLLRGEVLARWQQFVGTGEFLKRVESRISGWRDRVTAVLTGHPAPSPELGEVLQSGVAQLIVAHAEGAAMTTARRWRAVPGGAAIVIKQPHLARLSEGFHQRAQQEVRAWQGDILELVRAEGKDRRTTARLLAFGLNAVGVVLMLVVFSHTMGLSGGEVGIAGGSAVLAQRLLEAIFGDQAVRVLAEKARQLLVDRTTALYRGEQARIADGLTEVQVDVEQPERLLAAVASMRVAR
ncbi:MAG TPA: ABC transporter [Dermatophilaceae bacterium]|nr:ABC transporter [Dermatophilaceae bacterium]